MYVYDPNLNAYVWTEDAYVVYVPQSAPFSPMEFLPQVMYTALSLGVFAQALGMIVVATGAASGFATSPAELMATDPAVEDLRKAYGDDVVSRALTDVPDAEAIALAQRVEHYVYQDMRERYGDWAANMAIEAAPPGDIRTAQEIARTLSDRNITPASTAVEKVRAVATGKMRGRSKAEPQRDTKTGITYPSKYAAGKAVAHEYGLDPTNTLIWYKIIKQDPKRFVPA